MIRVLQIVDHMGLGGIQAFIMNVYRNIDREKFQFDFLVHKNEGNTFAEEIELLGGVIHYVPARNQGILKNRRVLDAFFKMHPEYKVVHQHESSLSYIEPLIAAKNNNVPIRIIHSHSTRMGNSLIHKILHILNSRRINRVATHYLACGELAGKWMYGKSKVRDKFTVIINGIKLKDFEYNESIRNSVRSELKLVTEPTYCHIGRFDWVKNHTFLIDIFNEIVKLQPSSKLLLVGQGVLMDDTQKKVKSLGLEERVLFLGLRSDIDRIVQAVDAIILPSFYEGFPVTAIEAQAAGVSFFMSDTVSKEAMIKSNSYALSLNNTAKEWADFIVPRVERLPDNKIMYDRGFDIQSTVNDLCKIYNRNYE
jgi:glycosyltransferase involved in cell wall biosynthesis